MQINILRIDALRAKTGQSRTVVYKKMSEGLWPKQVRLGTRCVGWPEHEADAMNAAYIAQKTPDEIRALVLKLEQERIIFLSIVNHNEQHATQKNEQPERTLLPNSS